MEMDMKKQCGWIWLKYIVYVYENKNDIIKLITIYNKYILLQTFSERE